jgi:hypothetical protein
MGEEAIHRAEHRRQHLLPSATWASIDIAEPGDEPVAHPAPRPRIPVIENPQ